MKKEFSLKIIGEGKEKEKLEKLAKSLGIDVKFTGKLEKHEDVVKAIKEAFVFVLPSKRESFGITVLEAMACRTPVIATETEGPRDYIENDKDGFLTKINDAEDLAIKN